MDKIKYWDGILTESNFFMDILHWLGWALVKGLQTLADGVESLVDGMYELLDFTTYIGIDKFFSDDDFKILLIALFAFALIVLAWTLIFNNKENHKPKVIQQLCIFALIITGLPTMFTWLNDITEVTREYIQGDANTNLSDEILADSITDLKYIDDIGFDKYSVKGSTVTGDNGKNGFTGDKIGNIRYIKPDEKITDESDINNEDILLRQLTTTENGTLTVAEFEEHKFLGIDMTDWYYRYHIDYLSIYLSFLAIIVTYLLTAWKIGQIIYEIAFHQLMAVFMTASDLTTGQRTKTVFKSIGSLYTVLMLLPLLLRIFTVGQSYIMSTLENSFIAAFAVVALAFFIVQGPCIIEKCLGVDAGVKNGFQTLFAGYMAARSAFAVASGVSRTASSMIGGAAGAVKGGIEKGIEGYRNSRNTIMSNNAEGGGIHTGNNSMNNPTSTGEQGVGKFTNNETNGLNDAEKEKISSPADIEKSSELSSPQENGSISDNNSINDNISNGSETLGNNENNVTPLSQTDNKGGISDGVQKSIENKKNSSLSSSDNLSQRRFQPNPNGIVGRTKRSYENGKTLGGAIGGTIGKGTGKIANKIGKKDIRGGK